MDATPELDQQEMVGIFIIWPVLSCILVMTSFDWVYRSPFLESLVISALRARALAEFLWIRF
jgi:hypothetical protein